MSALFDPIDLERLPPVAEWTVNYDAELVARIESFLTDAPEYAETIELESDPVRKLLQEAAYLAVLAKNAANQAVRQSMLATASGAELDAHAALIPILRKAEETDDRFRLRIRRSHSAFSVAGPRSAYETIIRERVPDLIDIDIRTRTNDVSVDPGVVKVYVLTGEEPEGSADVAKRNDVAVVLDDDVVPDTDQVIVLSPVIADYSVHALLTINPGPGQDQVLAAAQSAVTALTDNAYQIGGSVSRDQLIAALVVEGVTKVDLQLPEVDIDAAALTAPRMSALTVLPEGDPS
ncbi:baseplate J/gp47 family protein [Algimonas porphyrae]|uniref:Bacteriophage protein n=1 Tax=Algimonas porphyrae TaxID=1128113 RepID=A0ABQ5V0N4_9PROT|nr:baseplate J/gp47 family protein [Algimonas porphyrae]GLQ20507.1 bacteriophage protein [Algimonas porphyrae]